MCAGCFTTVDSYVMSAVALGAAVEAGVCRVKAMFDAEYAVRRPVMVWERNAAFCQYMGLDPATVLGPKPAPLPVTDPLVSWQPAFGTATFAAP